MGQHSCSRRVAIKNHRIPTYLVDTRQNFVKSGDAQYLLLLQNYKKKLQKVIKSKLWRLSIFLKGQSEKKSN